MFKKKDQILAYALRLAKICRKKSKKQRIVIKLYDFNSNTYCLRMWLQTSFIAFAFFWNLSWLKCWKMRTRTGLCLVLCLNAELYNLKVVRLNSAASFLFTVSLYLYEADLQLPTHFKKFKNLKRASATQ